MGPSSPPDDLAQAVALLRAGRLGEARALLVDLLRRDPRSDQAWFLLSLAVDGLRQQRDCLQRALRLNPAHSQARERLAELDAEPVAPLAPVPTAPAAGPPSQPAPPTQPPPAPQPAVSEPVLAGPAPAPVPGRPRPAPAKRAVPGWAVWALLGIGGLGAVACVAVAGLVWSGYFNPAPTAVVVVNVPTAISFPTLPPTWTASPTPTATPIPSATSTRTPTPTPSLPPPNATMLADMAEIAQQVSDLRGLAIQGENPSYLVSRSRVEDVLRGLVLNPELEAELEDQKLVLSVLGLIKPTYDLVKYALNSQADNIGGFYLPWTKEMYVIGSQFGGIERFIYSHEYDHALTDAHFGIDALGVYPMCESNAQRCGAIRALVEGDATLLMEQWWRQYATPQDYEDIFDYEPPRQIVPEEFPPPYIVQDLSFPYDYGYAFVSYLYDRGNWAAVNRAYADLPQSTEHILHPETYLAGEAPVEVSLPSLAPALDDEWRLVDDDVLGEWMTFLILGYGADFESQVDDETARRAAEGWGGDHYQVYHEASSGATLLVARWSWDTQSDASQFDQAFQPYGEERFRGARLARTDGACWVINGQASCLFTSGSESLWLLAPDEATLNEVLVQFPDF